MRQIVPPVSSATSSEPSFATARAAGRPPNFGASLTSRPESQDPNAARIALARLIRRQSSRTCAEARSGALVPLYRRENCRAGYPQAGEVSLSVVDDVQLTNALSPRAGDNPETLEPRSRRVCERIHTRHVR